MNLLNINKYFTGKILLILEVTSPSELSEKRIQKPPNYVFLPELLATDFSQYLDL